MKKFALILCTLFLGIVTLMAQSGSKQPYQHSVGGVVGMMEGFSYKGFITNNVALQADAAFGIWIPAVGNNLKVNANIMYEKSIKNGWYWFAGGGLHTGVGLQWENTYYTDNNWSEAKKHHAFFFGLNAIGGAEYKFAKIPLTLQADIRPGVAFYTHKFNPANAVHTVRTEVRTAFDYNLLQISARYTF